MEYWAEQAPATRDELRFGGRRMRCFAERLGGLHDTFAAAVARNPGGEALVFGERRLTWGELDRQVARFAAGLRRRGKALTWRRQNSFGRETTWNNPYASTAKPRS